MLIDWIPFDIPINTAMIAGATLWALGLYLTWGSGRNWLIEQLQRWFNFAERSLYTSVEEYERTREAREAQNAFYASVMSIVPFLFMGTLCNWGVQWGLGGSWSISLGVLTVFTGAVYALGKQSSKEQ
ncbi:MULTISPECIES: hypothetical protein [unclassified Synechocystis]|uniref:hypothetical protein n=1 Tax=unclassified Synechocystis TaxID=2640012 RepID=UPI00048BC20F|nr:MULTISPECIES: hypothetical protein [unclassified Synechocystis]AIE72565.2 hypothetical protein D082_00360 [Synechocystis sp. PCC 6714]MCT0254484.1 hypothetical protein [Synechocystis sp. CS-94]